MSNLIAPPASSKNKTNPCPDCGTWLCDDCGGGFRDKPFTATYLRTAKRDPTAFEC